LILVDFSSILHRKLHTSIAQIKPKIINGKFNTQEFINLTKYYILQDLFEMQTSYSNKYGKMIICLDDASRGYWRKDVYPGYKSQRKSNREATEIDFPAVFDELNVLTDQITNNLPWKVVQVPRAEADDTMLVLADVYNEYEPILICSPDKDMIQAQRNGANVQQYSSMTKQWLKPETKAENMEEWIQEHCILGDVSDGVPKVVDGTIFSDAFLSFLHENNMEVNTPMEFRASEIDNSIKAELITDFNVWKLNRKGENTGIKDIYNNPRFGASTLKKKIKEHGTVDKWLDSHPLYRQHYDRNYTLVMQEGIPEYIRDGIVQNYRNAGTEYKEKEFIEYLSENGLKSIVMELPNIFKIDRELNADDFGW